MGLRGFWCRLVSFEEFGGERREEGVWADCGGVFVVCITLGPTWFTAGVYVTLSKM